MKWTAFFIIFFLIACEPLSLDSERDVIQDDGKGRPDFSPPDIENLSGEEVRENKEGCKDYTNHTSRSPVWGNKSPFNPVVNCIAYNIDMGLKPICEQIEATRAELNKSGHDPRYQEEIEIYLQTLEEERALSVEYIYELSDPVYEACGDFEDFLDDETDNIGSNFLRTLGKGASDVFLNSECRRLYRVMEGKANLSCGNIDFSSFNRRTQR